MGFSDCAHFIRHFQLEYGCTPGYGARHELMPRFRAFFVGCAGLLDTLPLKSPTGDDDMNWQPFAAAPGNMTIFSASFPDVSDQWPMKDETAREINALNRALKADPALRPPAD